MKNPNTLDVWLEGTLDDQQSKFTLARIGDSWYEPTGKFPSTHRPTRPFGLALNDASPPSPNERH